ncbi:MAG: MATE family efflux transporter, partial [Candidatus Fimadaptatus sp.]
MFQVQGMIKPDLVQGDLPTTKQAYKDVINIALPSVMELVLISLINSVDTMMVGTCGDAAIAAVGLVGQPRMLLLALFFALNIGVTALVARRKGEGRQADANQVLRNALVIILALSVVIMVIALQFSRQLMQLAGAEADTIEDANTYFRIMTAVLPVNAMTLCINAALRGIGNTRTTMKVNITSNLVNIVFN